MSTLQNSSVPPQPTPAPSVLQASTVSADAKIRSGKYLLTILGVVILYLLIAALGYFFFPIPSAVRFIYSVVIPLVLLAVIIRDATKLKRKGSDQLTENEKYRMVLLMSFEPILGQAIYYYKLRKSAPNTARTAHKIGWKVLGLQFVPALLGGFALVFIVTAQIIQAGQWFKQNGAQLSSTLTSIESNRSRISSSGQSNNALGVQSACEALKKDVVNLKNMPSYPIKSARKQLDNATSSLSEGANDCVNSIKNNDNSLGSKARAELENGLKELNAFNQQVIANEKRLRENQR